MHNIPAKSTKKLFRVYEIQVFDLIFDVKQ